MIVIRENPTNCFESTLQSVGHLMQKLGHILHFALRMRSFLGAASKAERSSVSGLSKF